MAGSLVQITTDFRNRTPNFRMRVRTQDGSGTPEIIGVTVGRVIGPES